MANVTIDGISKAYQAGVPVLKPIQLEVADGELFFLLGPSGCGKSTLLRILAGLVRPDGGTIRFDGRDITSLPPEKRRAAMVFQNYALWPNMTVYQNISFGLSNIKEELPKIDFEAKNAARLAQILQTPSDVTAVLDECRDKDGKLEEKKAVLKLIDAFTLSQYTAKKLFGYHLENGADCAQNRSVRHQRGLYAALRRRDRRTAGKGRRST